MFERNGLDSDAEHARDRLRHFMDKLDASAKRYEDKRAARHEQSAAAAG